MADKNQVDNDRIQDSIEGAKIRKWILIAAVIIAVIFAAIVIRYIIGGTPDVHTIEGDASIPDIQEAIDIIK